MTDRAPRDEAGRRLPLEAQHFDKVDRFEEARNIAARIYERAVAGFLCGGAAASLDELEEEAWKAALFFLSCREKREEQLDREMFEATEKRDREEKLAGRPT